MADPPPPHSFTDLQASLKSALLTTTRTTSALCAEDLPFHRSLDPDFARDLDGQNARLLALAERLLASAVAGGPEAVSTKTTASSRASVAARLPAPRLPDADALDRNWSSVVDVVDSLLERTDGVLDEVRGVIKKGVGAVSAAVTGEAEKPALAPRNKKAFQQAANILKPQRTFANAPDNFATGPWKPILTRKPHAKISLEESLRTETSLDGTQRQIYKHPYQTEIEEYKYPPSMYLKREPTMYQPYEGTTATFVDTEEAVDEMLEELKKAGEIAIDIEHHDQRTYIGVVCLMQISTRDRDWVIDTLKPWRRRLECLNEVFADPNILKVLHGSTMDVIWLQRDLGLYLVGVFDTEHAATALHYPKRSLAYLLEKFINFQAQKQYQLADWRVRPLSKELFDYARSDTHFLLYIYDCMRNELVENTDLSDPEGDLIDRVLRESKRYQLQRYENPFYDAENGLGPTGWYKQLFRTPALLSKQQFAVFKAVHQWRDNTARKEDESLPFVMSNHLLQTFAREMPTTKEALLAATPAYAGLVRQNVDQLIALIADAKEKGVDGPEMRDAMAKSDILADEQHNNRVQARHAVESAIRSNTNAVVPKPASAVAEPLATAKRPTVVVDLNSVKSDSSSFWGSTLGNATQQRPMSTDVRLSLPMPEVSAEIFVATAATPVKIDATPASPTPTRPTAVEESPVQPVPKEETEDVFVLREQGRKNNKRKVTEVQNELQDGLDEINDASIPRRKEKKLKKKKSASELSAQEAGAVSASNGEPKKKTKKEPKKAQSDTASGFLAALLGTSDGGAATAAAEDEEEPFDYANAPSVLNAAPPDSTGKKKKKGKKSKMDGFDPYKKGLDASKGVPRAQKERIGKAATFKS